MKRECIKNVAKKRNTNNIIKYLYNIMNKKENNRWLFESIQNCDKWN